MCDYCSDRSESVPAQCSVGKVNAIAGANRRPKQQAADQLEEAESSTSTSDESSDDEMDTKLAENVLVPSTVSDDVTDAACDIKTDTSVATDSMSVDSSVASQQQHSVVENSASQNAEPVTVRQKAVHIAVNRTADIQVFFAFCMLRIIFRKLSVHCICKYLI